MDDYLSLLLEMQRQDVQEARQGFVLKDLPVPVAGGEKRDADGASEEKEGRTAETFSGGQKENGTKEEETRMEAGQRDGRAGAGLRWFLREMEPVHMISHFAAEQKNEGTGRETGTGRYSGFFGTEMESRGSTLTPEALSMFFQRDARRYS